MPKKYIPKLELVKLNSHLPVAEIEKATGIRPTMVYYYLRQLGIKPFNTKKIPLPSPDELRAEGLSKAGLAKKYGVSVETIKRRLK